jgi:hypothetical protein
MVIQCRHRSLVQVSRPQLIGAQRVRWFGTAAAVVAMALCGVAGGTGSGVLRVADSQAVVAATPDTLASDAQVTPQRAFPAGAAKPQTLPPVFDDIALASASRVVHNGLGLFIRNSSGGRVSVAVHDVKGRPVITRRYTASARTITVPTDGFTAGVYVYTVRMADSVFTKPFIITR